jgi:hypothetical protein
MAGTQTFTYSTSWTAHSGVFGRSERPKLSVLLNRFGTCCRTDL